MRRAVAEPKREAPAREVDRPKPARVSPTSPLAGADAVLDLQRQAGNQAVTALIQRGTAVAPTEVAPTVAAPEVAPTEVAAPGCSRRSGSPTWRSSSAACPR